MIEFELDETKIKAYNSFEKWENAEKKLNSPKPNFFTAIRDKMRYAKKSFKFS